MSTDRESVALLACGVSPYRFLRPVMTLALVPAAATMYVMIEAMPDANQRYREILSTSSPRRSRATSSRAVFFEQFPNWALYPREDAGVGRTGWRDLMVANTSQAGRVGVCLASQGRLVLDAKKRTVELVLTDGTSTPSAVPGEANTTRFSERLIMRLDPNTIFPPLELARGFSEKTIAQLRADIAQKVQRGESPHTRRSCTSTPSSRSRWPASCSPSSRWRSA